MDKVNQLDSDSDGEKKAVSILQKGRAFLLLGSCSL